MTDDEIDAALAPDPLNPTTHKGHKRQPHRPVPKERRHEVVHAVCLLMAQGHLTGDALGKVGLTRVRLFRWMEEDQALHQKYLRARVMQAEALAEKAVRTARRPVGSIWEATQRRTEVAALQWAASKLDPSRWADKVEVQHTSTKVVRHVVALPPRPGPPPAIIAGGLRSIGEGTVIPHGNPEGQPLALPAGPDQSTPSSPSND